MAGHFGVDAMAAGQFFTVEDGVPKRVQIALSYIYGIGRHLTA